MYSVCTVAGKCSPGRCIIIQNKVGLHITIREDYTRKMYMENGVYCGNVETISLAIIEIVSVTLYSVPQGQ